MSKLLVIAALVALLALSAESFRVPREAEEEPGPLASITDTVKSYFNRSVSTVSSCVESIKGLKLEEKAQNIYDDTVKAVGTYAGIVQDQLYHIFYPQQ
ncbi:apolipoprotein C-II [Lampris incognitus]|uniref:apolipoprotein C-II n=1 Tax=Lampris incognitus TaxID=2546036 RepID=UPI0024B5C9BA|nr:apolipoprotein C-II [Lampris incognitus]